MTRCCVQFCGDPVRDAGFVCVVCGGGYCAYHAGRCCAADIECCDNCQRQCCSCGIVGPANQGADLREMDWLCSTCLAGDIVIAVELARSAA